MLILTFIEIILRYYFIILQSVGPILYSKTCLYTMPKDRDFVVDNLSFRRMPQIIVCCGAGHVYKYVHKIDYFNLNIAPVLTETLT